MVVMMVRMMMVMMIKMMMISGGSTHGGLASYAGKASWCQKPVIMAAPHFVEDRKQRDRQTRAMENIPPQNLSLVTSILQLSQPLKVSRAPPTATQNSNTSSGVSSPAALESTEDISY